MTEYRDVSWGAEDITAEKLNQMASNEKFLLERIIPQRYQAYGINKTSGVKIACGITAMSPNTARQIWSNIYFGRFFTPGCRPVVLASLATPHNHRVFITVKGIGHGNMRPDHNGFAVVLNADPLTAQGAHFPHTSHIHWIAVGY